MKEGSIGSREYACSAYSDADEQLCLIHNYSDNVVGINISTWFKDISRR